MSHTVEIKVHFGRADKGRLVMRAGPPPPPVVRGRVPRISRLMALAIRMDRLVREGGVRDYAELARVGRVTRARVTQVMAFLQLAPDIQEQILWLPLTEQGRDPISEHDVRPIAACLSWREQRRQWAELLA